uniref:THAP-type domain-containing protein n=1 Tax=Magallana gigas TaxID=29159 RepID=A0A8W8NT97_MAGGI
MVKTCAWGRCNSDTRRPERIQGVHFIPFPKPKTQKDRCLRWIKACGRPHYQLNESRINRHTFVCTKVNITFSRILWIPVVPLRNIQIQYLLMVQTLEKADVIGENEADSCQIDHRMQKKLQVTEEKLHHQTVLNQHLNLQLSTIRSQSEVQIEGLNIEKIIQQEKKITGFFLYYTSLKHSTFVTLYNILTEQQMPVFPKKKKDVKTMKPETQLLLTLMRLRHNFGLKDLAARFLISTQSVSEIFSAWIEHMYLIL